MACIQTAVTSPASQLLSKSRGGGGGAVVGISASKAQYSWQPCKTSRVSMCMSSLPVSPPAAAAAMPLVRDSDSLLSHLSQSVVIPPKVDDTVKIEELRKRTRRALRTSSDLVTKMNMIDTIQRLGIGYNLEEDINEILENISQRQFDEDLYTADSSFGFSGRTAIRPLQVLHFSINCY